MIPFYYFLYIGQYKNDYILHKYVKIGMVVYYNITFFEFVVLKTSLWSGWQHIWTQKPDSYAAFTNRTDIGNCILFSTHYIPSWH